MSAPVLLVLAQSTLAAVGLGPCAAGAIPAAPPIGLRPDAHAPPARCSVARTDQEDPEAARVRRILQDPRVQEAFRLLETEDARTLADQRELTEIPAPPFMEEERGRRFLAKLRELGVDSAWIDAEGNVLGLRRGTGASDETLVLAGHLDTVFPEGTDVTVRELGDTLAAPGIGDDGRGLATVLAVLRVMNQADLRTDGDVLFVATVGEEGLGDLRGMKHLFRQGGPSIDAFVSVDGTSPERIVHRALGSHRYRVTFRGPGGHSWGAFGLANPAHALGRAIQYLDLTGDAFTRSGARTSYNVGRIGGGTSVNSIPFEAWMEVDMRSESQERLIRMDSLFQRAVQRALEEANASRREGPPLEVDVEMIGDRPSGEIAADETFVRRARAATRALGLEPALGISSTDANIPISRGIPAITVGGGGEGIGSHSPDERYVNTRGPLGIQRVLLIVLAQAGLATASAP